MAFVSSGIEKVRVFELPGGVWADGRCVGAPRIAIVKWRSCWSDKFHQVYVNGRYSGSTIDSQQREMIVHIPASLESPLRIEVFAVGAEEAYVDFSSELDLPPGGSGRVKISFLRHQNLPVGAIAQIYFDNGTGQINYTEPLNSSPIRIWPAWQDKAGFGMSRFGASDFGFDSAAAVGFGKGSFGRGQFGLDADTFEWVSRQLPTGVYKFGVKIIDEAGNESDSTETDQINVTPAAKPVEQVSVFSFNKQTNQLVLSVS